MDQVFEVSYSAILAALLLKKKVVTYNELIEFSNRFFSLGKNYYVLDDENFSNLPYIYNLLDERNNQFALNYNLRLETVIENETVRNILERCAGQQLLRLVGYESPIKSSVKNSNNKKNKFKVLALLSSVSGIGH